MSKKAVWLSDIECGSTCYGKAINVYPWEGQR